MEKENLLIIIEMYMRETGKMVKQMGMEYLLIILAADTRDFGKMIYSMDLERKFGQTEIFMKASMLSAKKMVKGSIDGMMGVFIKEIG